MYEEYKKLEVINLSMKSEESLYEFHLIIS